jgi:hypothetical protein
MPRGVQTVDRDARVVRCEIADPLIVDPIAPARIDKPIDGALDEKIAKVEGIKDTGVINGDWRLRGHGRA